MPKFPLSGLSKNQLLARLPPAEYQRLAPDLKAVHLPVKQTLYNAYAPINYAYFPLDGVISAMTIMDDGSAIEVATIGKEGIAGLSASFGGETSPYEVMVQVECDAMRMSVDVLKGEADKDGSLQKILSLYNVALQTQIGYSVACNGLHTIDKRCCRWLLMTQDLAHSDTFHVTHQFLAYMLGVRREGVTTAAQSLQQSGLIAYRRGDVHVLDRQALEAAACSCYASNRAVYARLLN